LKRIDTKVAAALSKHSGDLTLGLESIDADIAALLVKNEGELNLDSLRTLDQSSAEKLAASKFHLSLNAIKLLSDGAAWALTKHTGGISMAKLSKKVPVGELGVPTLRLNLD
jgi:hypothetical protein